MPSENLLVEYYPALLVALFFVQLVIIAGLVTFMGKLNQAESVVRQNSENWLELLRQIRYEAKLAKDTAHVAREDLRDALRSFFGAMPTVLRLLVWFACRKRPAS